MDPSKKRLRKRQILDKMISRLYAESTPTDEFFANIDFFLGKMADSVSSEIPGFGFDLYGSFTNGFVTKNSDLDISIFPSEQIRGKAAIVAHLQRISDVLNRMGIRNSVLESARVPIIKCEKTRFPGIEMDISYDNKLAFFNTRLLNLYCQWEPNRLPQLGIFVKSWAKECDICDASRKFPSSYAWILMLIHYLQACKPPVLPCLQKKFNSKTPMTYEHWISGKLDFKVCTTIEKNWSKNRKTTGELFLDFLNYLKNCGSRKNVMLVSQLGMGQPEWLQNYGAKRKLLVQDPFVYWESGTIGSRDAAEVDHIFKVIDLTLQSYNELEINNASEFFQQCKFKITLEAAKGNTSSEVRDFYEKDQNPRFSGPSHEVFLAERFGSRAPKPIFTQEYFTQEDCNSLEPKDYSRLWPQEEQELVQESVEATVQPQQNVEEEPDLLAQFILPALIKIAKEISILDFLLYGFIYTLSPYMETSNMLKVVCLLVAWLLLRAFVFPDNGYRLVQHACSSGLSISDVITIISVPIYRLPDEECIRYSRCSKWFSSSKTDNSWTRFDNQWMYTTLVSDRQPGRF